MSKIFKVGSKQDTLAYYVAAPNRETAIHLVEKWTGPQNPAVRVVVELPAPPDGYKLTGAIPCLLEEDPDYEG